jgi:hypothetical protein
MNEQPDVEFEMGSVLFIDNLRWDRLCIDLYLQKPCEKPPK